MPLIQLPVYSRFIFELTDPSGGPPRQASVLLGERQFDRPTPLEIQAGGPKFELVANSEVV